MENELERGVFLERYDSVDHRECREYIAPLRNRANGACRPLETRHRRVAIHADDERIATSSRTEQHIDMTGMEEVEHTIGEHHPSLLPPTPRRGTIPVHDLRNGIEGL